MRPRIKKSDLASRQSEKRPQALYFHGVHSCCISTAGLKSPMFVLIFSQHQGVGCYSTQDFFSQQGLCSSCIMHLPTEGDPVKPTQTMSFQLLTIYLLSLLSLTDNAEILPVLWMHSRRKKAVSWVSAFIVLICFPHNLLMKGDAPIVTCSPRILQSQNNQTVGTLCTIPDVLQFLTQQI